MSETQANPSKIDLTVVQPYTPTEAQIKKYTSKKSSGAWKFLFGSIAFLVIVAVAIFLFVSIFHVFVYSIRIIIALLLVLILPIYAVYTLCSTISNLSKKNYSFYTGEILAKNDKGYFVKGIQAEGLSFLDRSSSDGDMAPGAQVIVVQMKDDFDLLSID